MVVNVVVFLLKVIDVFGMVHCPPKLWRVKNEVPILFKEENEVPILFKKENEVAIQLTKSSKYTMY